MPERRGGKREGAGRPSSSNPLRRVSIRLAPEGIERLREGGGGNVSEGVRRLVLVAEAAASACRERGISPHLIDVLDAAGYETAPRPPDPDEWMPPSRRAP